MLNRCRVIILLRIRILIFACQLQSDADPDPAYKFVADPDACILQNDGQVNNKKQGSPQYMANTFDLPPSQSLLHFICQKTSVLRVFRIRIHQIHKFLGLLDPDLLIRGIDPDPHPDLEYIF
jgi:hypothetical protein